MDSGIKLSLYKLVQEIAIGVRTGMEYCMESDLSLKRDSRLYGIWTLML